MIVCILSLLFCFDFLIDFGVVTCLVFVNLCFDLLVFCSLLLFVVNVYHLLLFRKLQDSDDEAEQEKGASRGEKKARKALSKMGLVAVPGIERVTMKKSKNILIVFSYPDVFKTPNSETYVVFGEAKVEDLAAKSAALAAQQAKAAAASASVPETVPEPVASSSTEEVDETGIDAKDIDLVVNQAGCSRAAAVTALRKNNSDIVNSIMELTM